jgi:hypothetical protein
MNISNMTIIIFYNITNYTINNSNISNTSNTSTSKSNIIDKKKYYYNYSHFNYGFLILIFMCIGIPILTNLVICLGECIDEFIIKIKKLMNRKKRRIFLVEMGHYNIGLLKIIKNKSVI